MDTQYLLDTAPGGRRRTTTIPSEESNQIFPKAVKDTPNNMPPQRSLLRPDWFRNFQETWILELLGLLCSAIGLIAIAIILRKYDGKQRPTWSVSLNAIVSILSAIVNIGALYSVTHAVNQLKWVWFSEKERTLADIQMFDSASRGVFGSMALIFHLRARYAPPTSISARLSLSEPLQTPCILRCYCNHSSHWSGPIHPERDSF